MEDFEKQGVFYLGRKYDLSTKQADGPLLYDSKDLVTHGVCVGMTGSGKTGLCIGLLEEAALDGVPSIIVDPKGDLVDLLLTFPAAPRRGLPAVDQPGGGRQEGPLGRRVRPAAGGDVAEGPRRLGSGPGPHRAAQERGRLRHLHTRFERRAAGQHPQVVRRARPGGEGRRRGPARPHQHGRHQHPGPRGSRRRPHPEPRAHPAVESVQHGLERRPRPRSAGPHHPDPGTALPAGRGDEPGVVLSVEGPQRARHAAEQPVGRADLSVVAARRPARHRAHAAHSRGQAAGDDLLHRPPGRLGAHVLRVAAAERGAGLGARPTGHRQPAGHHLHGRDLRLLPAGGGAALQAAAPHPAEAGPGVRCRGAARHAEPGRPRLQGSRQRRHLVDRPAADRA